MTEANDGTGFVPPGNPWHFPPTFFMLLGPVSPGNSLKACAIFVETCLSRIWAEEWDPRLRFRLTGPKQVDLELIEDADRIFEDAATVSDPPEDGREDRFFWHATARPMGNAS
ncbi:MAG: hypothetical protein LBR80_02505 [Deltaproteobacteria bacterium]|jgi:hypothetical protein|nr:hypothetical protein [Deltaproteobacteria bacterium]